MPNGHMGPSYSIRVRDRVQWNTWVNRGDISHQRRVTRWGAWKTWRVARDAATAIGLFADMRKKHPLSDVGVFFGGKRLGCLAMCPVCRMRFPDSEPGDYTPNHGNGDEPCDGVGELLAGSRL